MGRGQDSPWNAHQSPGSCSSGFFAAARFDGFFPLWLHSLCQHTNQEPIKDECPGFPVASRWRNGPAQELSAEPPAASSRGHSHAAPQSLPVGRLS